MIRAKISREEGAFCGWAGEGAVPVVHQSEHKMSVLIR